MPATSIQKRVLITGAYGLIGNLVYARLAAQPAAYDVYGLVKTVELSARLGSVEITTIPAGRLRLADVSDLAAVSRAVAGMDAVIHLAADPDGRAGWESVLANNIVGTHNVF